MASTAWTPQLRTSAILAAIPEPLLSSRSRGWNGIVVELHRFHDVDALVQMPEHVVAVHIAGSIDLLQRRYGKACRRTIGPGDVIITPVGEPKYWQHAGETVVALLRLDAGFVGEVARGEFERDPSRLELQDNFGIRDSEIDRLGRQLVAALEFEGTANRMYAESLAIRVARHLARHYSAAATTAERPVAKLSRHKLMRSIEYIEDHLREEVTLRGIAQSLAMSPWHFARAFRQTMGIPPHRYVLERRIETAKSLLRESDLPITDIAHRIGCASHSHFSVMFHRVTGLTPRDYRDRA